MRFLLATLLGFLSLALISALDAESEVIQVRQVKRQDQDSLASDPATSAFDSSASSIASQIDSSASSAASQTMSPSPTTPISQDPTSTAQSASDDTAIVATGTEPESVSTTSMASSMVTETSSTPTISQDPTSTAQSASGDTAIVATGAAPTATGRWAAAGLLAVGIGGLMI